MRCLSPYANYSIQVFEGDEQIVVDQRGQAKQLTLSKPVIADFDRAGLLDHEIEVALETFSFSGLPEGVNPLTRISMFDSEAYVERFPKDERPEMLAKINERLRELQERHPGEFVIVEQPAAEKPWPSYDEDSAEEVIEFQKRLQINPERVRLYEVENLNRAEVVEAMLRQEDPSAADELYGPASGEAVEVVA